MTLGLPHVWGNMSGEITILKIALIVSIISFSRTQQNSACAEDEHTQAPNAKHSCINPNGHPGLCVPIEACKSLSDLMLNKIASSYQFIRESHCDNGQPGQHLPVCCTADTQFVGGIPQPAKSQGRITYPSDLKTSQSAEAHRIVYPGLTYIPGPLVPAALAPTPSPRMHRIVFPQDFPAEYIKSTGPTTASKATPPRPLPETSGFSKFPTLRHCGRLSISNKIYGGTESDLTEFPWMVNLEYKTPIGLLVSGCSGSLINERYVLTVAHCLKGAIEIKKGKIKSVRLGDHNTETPIDCNSAGCLPPPQRVGIEYIVVHEHFGESTPMNIHQHNDIGMIRLAETIVFNELIQPVCLPLVEPMTPLKDELKLTAAGWGHTGSTRSSPVKLKVELPLVNHANCRLTHISRFYLADEQLCAGGVFKEDSCTGDSGGPLMRLSQDHWIMEGLVSFGHGCGLENSPGIYTNVRYYLDWIDQYVQPWQ